MIILKGIIFKHHSFYTRQTYEIAHDGLDHSFLDHQTTSPLLN